MLNTPELAMNPKKQVTTVCYGRKKVWDDRDDAKEFFFEAMMQTEGAQRDHYAGIFMQLSDGLNYCTDGGKVIWQ